MPVEFAVERATLIVLASTTVIVPPVPAEFGKPQDEVNTTFENAQAPIEGAVRKMAKKEGQLYVITGPDGKDYKWKEVCGGAPRARGYLVLNQAEEAFPSWNEAVRGWIARARRGIGVGGGVDPDRTTHFYTEVLQMQLETFGAGQSVELAVVERSVAIE